MKNAIYALIPLVFLVGCGDATSGVKDAKGETPVKYVICGPGESNCFVAARFSDIEGCERQKNWSMMLCDSKSNPGMMVCTTNSEQVAAAYCTL